MGRRIAGVVGSWHISGGDRVFGPVDVWLIDTRGQSVHITTGSDWCLIVEASDPYAGYDMGASGRIAVEAICDETPLAGHVGQGVLSVREEYEPHTGRIALELVFPTGRVRCESWDGDLRLSSL